PLVGLWRRRGAAGLRHRRAGLGRDVVFAGQAPARRQHPPGGAEPAGRAATLHPPGPAGADRLRPPPAAPALDHTAGPGEPAAAGAGPEPGPDTPAGDVAGAASDLQLRLELAADAGSADVHPAAQYRLQPDLRVLGYQGR